MTTLIVGLIIAVLFGAGVGLLVMEHVITQRRQRAFLGQPIGMRTGMHVAKTHVQDQMFANLDEPLTDLFGHSQGSQWIHPNDYRGNFDG